MGGSLVTLLTRKGCLGEKCFGLSKYTKSGVQWRPRLISVAPELSSQISPADAPKTPSRARWADRVRLKLLAGTGGVPTPLPWCKRSGQPLPWLPLFGGTGRDSRQEQKHVGEKDILGRIGSPCLETKAKITLLVPQTSYDQWRAINSAHTSDTPVPSARASMPSGRVHLLFPLLSGHFTSFPHWKSGSGCHNGHHNAHSIKRRKPILPRTPSAWGRGWLAFLGVYASQFCPWCYSK
jgi:hypothetical protein